MLRNRQLLIFPTRTFSYFSQGLNVVIVSMGDKFLADTFASVKAQFPGQEFRKVGATFSPDVKYMEMIK